MADAKAAALEDEAEIEEGAGDGAAADVFQLVVDPGAAAAVESRHQRAVEEDQFAHAGEA